MSLWVHAMSFTSRVCSTPWRVFSLALSDRTYSNKPSSSINGRERAVISVCSDTHWLSKCGPGSPRGFLRLYQGICQVKTTFATIIRLIGLFLCVDICINDAKTMVGKSADVCVNQGKGTKLWKPVSLENGLNKAVKSINFIDVQLFGTF